MRTAEENAEIKDKIMFGEFDYVKCNEDSTHQIRPDYPKGEIREFESDHFVVMESDRPVEDMWKGGGNGKAVMVGNYFYKFYTIDMWKKLMELETAMPGSVFGGRSSEIIHNPKKNTTVVVNETKNRR